MIPPLCLSNDALIDVDQSQSRYSSPPVVVEGLVSQELQGAWRQKDLQVHDFLLSAWKPAGEDIRTTSLVVLRPCRLGEDWRGVVPAESIQRFRALLSDDKSRCIFIESLPLEGDLDALASIREELQKPLVVDTSLFGTVTLDRKRGHFVGKARWSGHAVPVSIVSDDEESLQKDLRMIEPIWSNENEWEERIMQAIAVKLVGIWNDNWRQDDEEELSASELLGIIQLRSISIERGGDFQFCYNDGGLFEGHVILVRGDVGSESCSAQIAG